MCAFCAGVPTTLTMGVALHVKQREVIARGESPRWAKWPIGQLTGLIVVALLAGSIWFHSHFSI